MPTNKPFRDSGGLRGSQRADIAHAEVKLKEKEKLRLDTNKRIRFRETEQGITLSVPKLGTIRISKANAVKLARWILENESK